MGKDGVFATITSRPYSVIFTCPHCHERVEVLFADVDFNTDYWYDGAYSDCPECGKEVEISDFDYD